MSTRDTKLKSLQNAIYRDKVKRARGMTTGERLSAGAELFDEAMARMKIGIRIRNPDADENEVNLLLLADMKRLRAWKERKLYTSAFSSEE